MHNILPPQAQAQPHALHGRRAAIETPAISTRAEKCWIAVASAEHVQTGVKAGIMQVCHGKGGPLRRIAAGDRVAYYSPTASFRGKDTLQAFTAVGRVRAGAAYQADMGGGFKPFRKDVTWFTASPAPIRPLLQRLAFTSGNKNWGYQLRFGLFEIPAGDMDMIATAMQACP